MAKQAELTPAMKSVLDRIFSKQKASTFAAESRTPDLRNQKFSVKHQIYNTMNPYKEGGIFDKLKQDNGPKHRRVFSDASTHFTDLASDQRNAHGSKNPLRYAKNSLPLNVLQKAGIESHSRPFIDNSPQYKLGGRSQSLVKYR